MTTIIISSLRDCRVCCYIKPLFMKINSILRNTNTTDSCSTNKIKGFLKTKVYQRFLKRITTQRAHRQREIWCQNGKQVVHFCNQTLWDENETTIIYLLRVRATHDKVGSGSNAVETNTSFGKHEKAKLLHKRVPKVRTLSAL